MPALQRTPWRSNTGLVAGLGGGSRMSHQPNPMRGCERAIAIASPMYIRRLAIGPIVHDGGRGVRKIHARVNETVATTKGSARHAASAPTMSHGMATPLAVTTNASAT